MNAIVNLPDNWSATGAGRVLFIAVMVIILTGADTSLSALGLLPLPAVVLSFLLLAAIVLVDLISTRGAGSHAVPQQPVVEIAIVMGILQAPTIAGILWVDFVPDLYMNLGLLAVYNSVMTILMLMVFLSAANLSLLARTARISLIVYVASIAFDLISGGLLSVLVARPAGFFGNPNDGALAVAALLVASLRWRKPRARDLGYLLVALGGIAITLSRSGLLAWLLIASCHFMVTMKNGSVSLRVGSILLPISILAAGFFFFLYAGDSLSISNRDSASRIEDIGNLVSGDVSSASNDPRILLFEHYVGLASQRPILGYGSSFSVSGFGTAAAGQDDQGPHNLFLARYVDAGVIGLVCLLAFILFWFAYFLRYRSPAGLIYVLFLVFAGVFSHDSLNRKALLGVLALLAAEAFLYQRRRLPAAV